MHDPREVYLGDGCYASFDSGQVRLRAPRENGVEHFIWLEPLTLQAFEEYIAALRADMKLGGGNRGAPHE